MENQGRFFIFLILSTLILVVWSQFAAPPPPPASTAGSIPAAASTAKSSGDVTSSSRVEKVVENVPPVRQAADIPVRSVTIVTDDYEAVFSSRGAVLTGYSLARFKDRRTKEPVQLVHVHPEQPSPLTLSHPALPGLSTLPFEFVGESKKLSTEGETHRLLFRARTSEGVWVEKSFIFTNGSYLFGYEVAVKNLGRRELPSGTMSMEWAPSLGIEEFTGTQSQAGGLRVATFAGGKMETQKTKKTREEVIVPAPVSWAALADQFFVAALIPDPATPAGARVARDFNAFLPATEKELEPAIDPKSFAPRPILTYAVPSLLKGEAFRRSGRVFLGPQEYRPLKELGLELDRVLDFGMFGFISVYMLKLLKIFFEWFGNWGLAIILLSILVKILLWWPTHSSYIHMSEMQRKMKDIQPQLEALKKKYANDRTKQQQEMSVLYQKAGINPMGGCLPMLLQIPVFFALYATLVHTVELRGAPFILWIRDLSLRDPSYVLPLLMGVSMIVQQRVSGQMGQSAQGGQQKFMMWFFPVFLTAISMQWPSGLLLYWVVTNLLSIVQQKMVNRQLKKARIQAK